MTTAAELDAILRKVQAMIARADHPNTPPAEAEACRVKADEWMTKFRLDEAMLGERGDLPGYLPQWRTFPVGSAGEFSMYYRWIASYVVRYLDIEAVFKMGSVDGVAMVMAECVGYDSDLRFAEVLITECALEFSKRLEPKYDPELSEQVNAYLMRSAGMEGKRIAQAIYGRDDKHLRPKVRKMFAAEAEARGEDPKVLTGQGNSVKVFRQSYAQGFAYEIGRRLMDMKLYYKAEGVALVLAGRKDKIMEAFYERYPQYRPRPASGAIGDGTEGCAKCKAAKSGYCREHSYLRPRKLKEEPFNRKGYDRGAAAARSVKLRDSKGSIGEGSN
jgi:hypothetical protein